MDSFLTLEIWSTLTPALLHTLWIATLSALVLAAALRVIPSNRPNLRYVCALIALVAPLAGGAIAWGIQDHVLHHSASVAEVANNETNATPAIVGAGSAAAVGESTISADTSARKSIRWESWAAVIWMLGVAAMGLRLIHELRTIRALQSEIQPEANTAKIEAMLSEVSRAMKIRVRVSIQITSRLAAPAVVGIARPLILWPASWLSGLSETELRVALAHELAHIRRYDYLVNLFQMFAEALLFFNPAIWWISRRIRLEREACCDAAASQVAGNELEVANTLLRAAEGLTSPQPIPAAAVALGRKRSGLFERIERLLNPASQPAIRLPWPSFALVATISTLALIMFKEAGDVLAEQILPAEERIKQMEEFQADFEKVAIEDRKYGDEDKVLLKFRLKTADGGEIPHDAGLRVSANVPKSSGTSGHSLRGHHGTTLDEGGASLDFAYRVNFGRTLLAFNAEGYAPKFAGPFLPEPGGELDAGTIVLERGFQTAVRLVNEDGAVIANAEVRGSFLGPIVDGDRASAWAGIGKTDDEGVFTLDNAGPFPLKLTAVAKGFEKSQQTFELTPNESADWRLDRATPLRGNVVDAHTGAPIVGAEILRIYEKSSSTGGSSFSPLTAKPEATTNDDGVFLFDTLERGATYTLAVKADGYARHFVYNVAVGEELHVELGPAIKVAGRFVGLADEDMDDEGNLSIKLGYNFRIAEDHSYGAGIRERVVVPVKEGVAEFELSDVWPAKLHLSAAGISQEIKVNASVDDFVIDVNAKRKAAVNSAERTVREIVLQLQAPKGGPDPSGAIVAEYTRYEKRYRAHQETVVPIDESGVARFKIEVPNRLELRPNGLRGFTFDKNWNRDGKFGHFAEISEDADPFRRTIELQPAGSIRGVFELDAAQPGPSYSFNVIPSHGVEMEATFEADGKFQFLAQPLPLGKTYRIVAHRMDTFIVSHPVSLTPGNPMAQVEMDVPPTNSFEVRVSDEAGAQLKGIPVRIDFETPGMGFTRSPVPRTDNEGWVQFDDVVPNQPDGFSYHVRIEPAQGFPTRIYQPESLDAALVVELPKGRVLEGQVVDTITGRPMPDVEVYALIDVEWRQKQNQDFAYPAYVDADAKTGADGRFRFSRLEEAVYQIGCRSGSIKSDSKLQIRAANEPLELKVEAADWYREKHGMK